MSYKYEEVRKVEVKEGFEAYLYDEDTEELIKTVNIPKGTKGEIVSMGWSSTEGFRHRYDIEVAIDGEEQEIRVYEDKLERYFNLNVPQ